MKFYKVINVFDWGEAPEDYCCTELSEEKLIEALEEQLSTKKGYSHSKIEEVEKPPVIWLKRNISNMKKMIEFYESLL